jgi:hypothetical protein
MIRSPMVRLLALAAGLSASLAGPALTLAHGHAHSEAVEHAAHHATSASSESHDPSIGASEHEQDHGHPRLDPSAFARLVKGAPAIHSEAVSISLSPLKRVHTADAPEPNETPPDRPGVSPPQSRAPPTL